MGRGLVQFVPSSSGAASPVPEDRRDRQDEPWRHYEPLQLAGLSFTHPSRLDSRRLLHHLLAWQTVATLLPYRLSLSLDDATPFQPSSGACLFLE